MNYYKVYIKPIIETDATGLQNIRHDLNGMRYYPVIMDLKDNLSWNSQISRKSLIKYGSSWLSNENLIVDIDHNEDADILEVRIKKIIRKELHRNKLIDDILK